MQLIWTRSGFSHFAIGIMWNSCYFYFKDEVFMVSSDCSGCVLVASDVRESFWCFAANCSRILWSIFFICLK